MFKLMDKKIFAILCPKYIYFFFTYILLLFPGIMTILISGIVISHCRHLNLISVIDILPGLKIRVCNQKLIFLFLNQYICCGYSKEPSQGDGSFEHPKQMF